MSSNDRLIETIEHYKRNISRACPDNEQLTDPKKVVYCLDKLAKLPINVELLSVTGIGRTVNELRKFEGPISEKAKILVTTWKAVVKAEEDKDPAEDRICASDVEESEEIRVNGNHHDDESSTSENEDNTSDEEEDNNKDPRNIRHLGNEDEDDVGNSDRSDEEDLDKENEREEDSEEESEDERQRRLKFEEEKKAYEEYLKAKRKKTLNGHVKNSENVKQNGEKIKSAEKREDKKPDEKRNRKEESKDKHRSDKQESSREKDKHRSSSDSKSSRDKHDKKNGERSRSRDNYQDSKHSSKSNGKDSLSSSKINQSSSKDSKSYNKDSKSNSTEKYSKEFQIKKEKIDEGYEKALDKRNGEKTSDKSSDSRKESDRKDKHKNGEEKNTKEDKSDRHSKSSRDDKSKKSSHSSSSSKHRDDRYKDQTKRKHEREGSESGSKRSKADVVVKREPVTSDDESRSSSVREESSSRESSVSAGARSVKKEKTESSSQKEKHISRDGGRAGGGSEPKKMKLVEATDGGFADALMSIEPTKKSKKKSSSSRKASEQQASPAAKSSRSSSPRHRSTTRSPSVHSSGSISPLDLLSGNVKLEPLEKLDIASTLPEISPDNYFKPHLYQSPSDKAVSQAQSHNDLCNIMTSKNQRTKVFSGSRVTLTKVPSLYDSCIRILQENIDSLEYTGGVPYDILKPVLERCTAEQLYQLEHYNPYLMEDTGSHWQFHCGRDFRGKKLQEYETWRELYLRCMLEREKKLKEVRSKVSLSKKQSIPVRTTKLAYVDSSFVKPPRQVARQQARHGTGGSSSSSGSSSGLTVSNPNKAEVLAKASVGAYSSSAILGGSSAVPVAAVKPGNSGVSAGASNPLMKKKKAPLMMKALQSFKGIRKR